jgi:CheY-like chemotaxis protein
MARIMVVEDEPITAADLEQKLNALGHDVTTWSDTGEDALLQARTCPPDLVLMDIRLRGSMSGIEAARRLREHSDVPVVFLTAFADPATIDQACETQPFGYLVKPFTEQAVASAVQVALTRAGAERATVERERFVSAGLQGAGEGLIALDSRGVVRFVNEHAEALLKVKANDVVGQPGDALIRFYDASDAGDPIAAALMNGQVTSSPSRALMRATEERLLVAYSAAPVFAPGSTKAGAILVFREAQPPSLPARARQLDVLSTLSSRLSHEINNPLTYNLGAVHLALKELDQLRALSAISESTNGEGKAQQQEHLTRIEGLLRGAYEGATRVAGVVRELGSFSLGKRDLSPVSPVDVLDLAMGLSEANVPEHVRLMRQVGQAPMIRANKWQLAQVLAFALESVLSSLAEHSSATVLLSLRTDARGRALFRIAAREGPSSIASAPEQAVAHPFLSPRPTSVGMTLVEQLIEAQGGEFGVSERPEGRMIELRLPPIDIAEPEAQLANGGTLRGSVLVIDDEPMIGRVLSISLESEHDVTAVRSAESALTLLEGGDAFDVILCDLAMPAMSGQDFFEHLSATRPDMASRVIFMSGGATSHALQRFLHAHKDQSIAKPFETEQLLRMIAERVRLRASAGARAQC